MSNLVVDAHFFRKRRRPLNERRDKPRLNIDKAITSIYSHGKENGYFKGSKEFEIEQITFVISAVQDHIRIPNEYQESLRKFFTEYSVNRGSQKKVRRQE